MIDVGSQLRQLQASRGGQPGQVGKHVGVADARLADLVGATATAALPAVVHIGLQVHAGRAAKVEALVADRLARPRLAQLVEGAGRAVTKRRTARSPWPVSKSPTPTSSCST